MNPSQWILTRFIRGYQLFLSPVKSALFGAAAKCRFTPTCSQYALEAIQIHGALKGTWLGLCRLLRCHPWGAWGLDPVPGKREQNRETCCGSGDSDAGESDPTSSRSSCSAVGLSARLSTLNCSQLTD